MRPHLILSAVRHAAIAAAILGGVALPATAPLAQEASAAAPGPDDLRALRYYIEQDETAAITAEIRRLQIDYPGWTPPEDLDSLLITGPSTEVDQIYARIAAGDVEGARRLIATTQGAFPNWEPPADMTQLLELASAQESFDTAVSSQNLTRALEIAVDTPQLLSCNRINNTWELAALQARSGNDAAALAAYRQIVQSCSGSSEIVSTIEKANAVSSADEIQALVSTAQTRLPALSSTLETLEARLLAGRGITPSGDTAEAPEEDEDEPAPAAAPAQTQSAPQQAAAPAPAPAPAPEPAPAPARRPASASPSAAPAPAPAASPSTVPLGMASSQSPYAQLPRSGDGRINAVRAAAQAENYRQCAFSSTQPRSLDVAYERAWCVYNLDRPLESLALFTAAADGRLGAVVLRDARYGMALSMLELEMTDAASQVAARTDFTAPQRRTIETIILDQRGVRAYEQGDYRQSIIYFNELERIEGSLRRDLELLRGYAMLNSGDQRGAINVFLRLNDELSTPETRQALAAARD
ncbi:hypothetical protein [Pseudoroseicyclus tamaricis]|uniref:hypothetical protein n=1 Tax=Pseudoroseicyclus tamaricis TaxID=2705421 RepID=UPI00193F6C1D|nr:hypothetical protein [Pseudoroseicyclus tamaricis]